MNIKANVVKSIGFAGVVSALTAAYAFQPTKPTEPVYVMAPFKFESIDIKNNTAAVETLNEQYVVEFEYVADISSHSNGVGGNWNEVEVIEIKEPRVYDENGEVANYYLSTDNVQEIVQVIEQELRERV